MAWSEDVLSLGWGQESADELAVIFIFERSRHDPSWRCCSFNSLLRCPTFASNHHHHYNDTIVVAISAALYYAALLWDSGTTRAVGGRSSHTFFSACPCSIIMHLPYWMQTVSERSRRYSVRSPRSTQ